MNVLQPPPPPPMMPDYNALLGTNDIGGFRYGIGVSIGVLLLITTITLTSYFCTRNQLSSSPSRSNNNQDSTLVHHHHHHVIIDVVSGLDEDTIQSYPKILYSEAKGHSTASCCPICLGDYKGKHLLRQLPDCSHLFHLKCIDTWLRLNPTCPVCRTSPLPTPLSTPLAEVVPLASSTVATTRMS
ncbi:unnamed protein product [Microthlaspi erraticum]|uniref:RING-type domain-containing protein n=1 Tax=Microthlaspi erraticum TaxID=1685480 RepID=A0A6D2HX58_9BRAS|nr:unnamed protein product [Microthlaspi erraticum]